jgi:hypothetical protein
MEVVDGKVDGEVQTGPGVVDKAVMSRISI